MDLLQFEILKYEIYFAESNTTKWPAFWAFWSSAVEPMKNVFLIALPGLSWKIEFKGALLLVTEP